MNREEKIAEEKVNAIVSQLIENENASTFSGDWYPLCGFYHGIVEHACIDLETADKANVFRFRDDGNPDLHNRKLQEKVSEIMQHLPWAAWWFHPSRKMLRRACYYIWHNHDAFMKWYEETNQTVNYPDWLWRTFKEEKLNEPKEEARPTAWDLKRESREAEHAFGMARARKWAEDAERAKVEAEDENQQLKEKVQELEQELRIVKEENQKLKSMLEEIQKGR